MFVKNSKVFLTWTMFDASVDYTFAKLFEEVHQLDSSSAHCSRIGDCFASQRVAVDLSFNVVECCTLNGRYSSL